MKTTITEHMDGVSFSGARGQFRFLTLMAFDKQRGARAERGQFGHLATTRRADSLRSRVEISKTKLVSPLQGRARCALRSQMRCACHPCPTCGVTRCCVDQSKRLSPLRRRMPRRAMGNDDRRALRASSSVPRTPNAHAIAIARLRISPVTQLIAIGSRLRWKTAQHNGKDRTDMFPRCATAVVIADGCVRFAPRVMLGLAVGRGGRGYPCRTRPPDRDRVSCRECLESNAGAAPVTS